MHQCTKCSCEAGAHPERCGEGCEYGHWPPLCCPGCGCGSYEEGHRVLTPASEEGNDV